jgi:site-specific DNA-methyltransferase (adenine-specific)/modification methylase
LATSKQGDVVLDPFLGSGTTAAVAKKLGRNYIGIEKDEFYLRVARRRLDAIHQLPSEVLDYPTEIKPPKVPFLSLIENNYINAGGRLYSEDKKFQAKVLANGTLKSNDLNGSIHKVSAQLLGKENNNGWTFWYYKDQDRLISIDEIRSRFVKENY